jgi:ferredoxin-like protein FixX
MFQALLAYLQEALHKQQLVHCVHIMPAGCYHPEDEHVMLKTSRGC